MGQGQGDPSGFCRRHALRGVHGVVEARVKESAHARNRYRFNSRVESRRQRSDELRAHDADLQAWMLARSGGELLRRAMIASANPYKAKLTDSHGAVEEIGSNSIVAIGQAVCQPPALMEAL